MQTYSKGDRVVLLYNNKRNAFYEPMPNGVGTVMADCYRKKHVTVKWDDIVPADEERGYSTMWLVVNDQLDLVPSGQ